MYIRKLVKLSSLIFVLSMINVASAAQQIVPQAPKVDYTPPAKTVSNYLNPQNACELSPEIISSFLVNKTGVVNDRIVDNNNFCCYSVPEDRLYNYCVTPHWQDAQYAVQSFQNRSNECRAQNGIPLRTWTVSACFSPTRSYSFEDHLSFEEFRDLWSVNLRDCARDLTQTYLAMVSDCTAAR